MDLAGLYPRPDATPLAPSHWADMLRVAADLSAPFDFVRIDLYQTGAGVFFGEFTFTPGAGSLKFSDPRYGAELMDGVRARRARGDLAAPGGGQ